MEMNLSGFYTIFFQIDEIFLQRNFSADQLLFHHEFSQFAQSITGFYSAKIFFSLILFYFFCRKFYSIFWKKNIFNLKALALKCN